MNGDSHERPRSTRRLFDQGQEELPPVEIKQVMEQPLVEARRVVKRLTAIYEDHQRAAVPLKIQLGPPDLKLVLDALRNHAAGSEGLPVPNACDEIHGYCLNRLFEELVEEPSNILFTTQKDNGVTRYDAMNAIFWTECLDLMETTHCS